MKPLQKALNKHLSEAPATIIRQIVERKIKAQGFELSESGLQKLVAHIVDGSDLPFLWSDEDASTPDITKSISLELTEADAEEVRKLTENLLDRLPDIVRTTIEKGGDDLFRKLKDDWDVRSAVESFQIDDFESDWRSVGAMLSSLCDCS